MKHQILNTILLLLLMLTATQQVSAQAFDGSDDRKLTIGYLQWGSKPAVEVGYQFGLADAVSIGGHIDYMLGNLGDEYNDKLNGLEYLDVAIDCDVHAQDWLHMPMQTDVYGGVSASFAVLNCHVGYRYNLGEVVGLYASAGYNLCRTFNDNDLAQYIAHKWCLQAGITFSF